MVQGNLRQRFVALWRCDLPGDGGFGEREGRAKLAPLPGSPFRSAVGAQAVQRNVGYRGLEGKCQDGHMLAQHCRRPCLHNGQRRDKREQGESERYHLLFGREDR